jgi:hypothetical protein
VLILNQLSLLSMCMVPQAEMYSMAGLLAGLLGGVLGQLVPQFVADTACFLVEHLKGLGQQR